MSEVPEVDKLSAAINEATDVLTKFSIPLYQDHNGRPSLHGTGFFVRSGCDHFLVSAAHVLDTAKKNGLYFYSTPNTLRHLSGQLLTTKGEANHVNDHIDIGVLKLSDGYAPPYPEVDKFAMDISYLRPGHRPRSGKSYILIGFPATKSKVNTQDKTATVRPYAYRNRSIDENEYVKHGLDPATHVAVRLDLRKSFGEDGTHQHFPKPQGMSGSPIVVLYEEEGDDGSCVFPVVAVATTYRKPSRILFGTDVSCVLDVIRRFV